MYGSLSNLCSRSRQSMHSRTKCRASFFSKSSFFTAAERIPLLSSAPSNTNSSSSSCFNRQTSRSSWRCRGHHLSNSNGAAEDIIYHVFMLRIYWNCADASALVVKSDEPVFFIFFEPRHHLLTRFLARVNFRLLVPTAVTSVL